ncbi:hypothetical protein N7468_009344 [Penicillium chermesinum]|uniref:Autophagy-related protein 29 n=1 Tax=Penicillium chermesinum TaxID=63820 RepID=A0A9W9NHN1_9EURO|nr:uncharacterized protein N7468_009344 [Penicillium chermesinum]KAJ5220140.1 hypothetical protein N7468_009344 [Penicillium chermesinum]
MAGNPSKKQFTVFVRVPGKRGDFVDPPQVNWNASKDQALWDLLSRPSKDDIDWKELAEHFGVTLQFLHQQAACLYDRQFSQVRAQMRKVAPATQSQSNSPSPGPGSASGSLALGGQVAGVPLLSGPRAPSRQISSQQEAPQRVLGGTGRRTSSTSTTTINQVHNNQDNARIGTPTAEYTDPKRDQLPYRPSVTRPEPPATFMRSPPLQEEDSISSSEESNSEDDSPGPAPWLKRFGHMSTHRPSLGDSDDGDDTPAFLPFTREPQQQPRDQRSQHLSGTLRLDQDPLIARQRLRNRADAPPRAPSESPASSISSGAPAAGPPGERHRNGRLGPRVGDPPRITSQSTAGSGREASDGTPSMGSSFSDLDGADASVTQSALEEALLSNMQHGGMASRMSTISQALRSRYLQ